MAFEVNNLVESAEVSSSSSPSRPPSPSSPAVRIRRSGRSTTMLLENHENFKKSSVPERVMHYDGSSWVDFPEEVVGEVKSAFVDRRLVVEVWVFGSNHVLDFARMVIVDITSGTERSVAWIDVAGKCFFPKRFLSPVEDKTIEIYVELDYASLKRKIKEEEEVASVKRRRLVPDDVAGPDWRGARQVSWGERDYSILKELFMSGMSGVDPGAVVTGIYMCTREGVMEKAREEVFKMQEEVTKEARGVSNTVLAWYGGSRKMVEGVLGYGFGEGNWRMGAFGVGVYLSPVGLPLLSAQLSQVDDNGEKHLILCRVTLGSVEKVVAGSKQRHPSSFNFDTGCDDPTNPKWYVVWPTHMSRHISPMCALRFKPSNHVQGCMKGSQIPDVRFTFSTLIRKLRTCLPPSKIQEVVNLFDTFRAGKLAREVFLKQLRCVAGDQVLRSAIQETQGF